MKNKTLEFILSPLLSLFSPTLYRSVLRASVSKGIFYLFYLSVLSAMCFASAMVMKQIPKVDEFVSWFTKEMPEITFTETGIQSPAAQPVEMKHPTLGTVLILDTTKDTLEGDEMKKALIYLTKTKVYANDPVRNETRILDILKQRAGAKEAAKSQTLTGDLVRKFYFQAKPYFLALLFFLMVAFIFMWKLAAAVFYSLPALVLNQFREDKFSYTTLLGVSMFALTPVTWMQFVNLFVPSVPLTPPFWMALVITTFYLGLAILFVAPPEK